MPSSSPDFLMLAESIHDMTSTLVTALRARPRPPASAMDPLTVARRLYALGSARARTFGDDAGLFSDPSWFILLDLFIASEEERLVSVSSASIAAHAPPTTGLRHLALLEERRLVVRSDDPSDRRRSHVATTARANAMIRDLLERQA